MNSRLRWRSLTTAWTLPVSRSIPANRLSVPWRLYSMIARKGGLDASLGGKSGAVVAMAWYVLASRRRRRPGHRFGRLSLAEVHLQDLDFTIDA